MSERGIWCLIGGVIGCIKLLDELKIIFKLFKSVFVCALVSVYQCLILNRTQTNTNPSGTDKHR